VNILQAPSQPEPYPYYARLRATPLAWDDDLKLWVVAAPALVLEALRHPQLRVRPPAEPVPAALQGGAAGEVFAQLVRMTDGAFHAQHKPRVEARAARFGETEVAAAALAAARDPSLRADPNRWLSAVPVQAMARLLGVGDANLASTVEWVHHFTRGIGPGADAAAIAQAHDAARALLAQGAAEGLDGAAAANRIAFMQQALDATAGLIGNAVLRRRAGDAAAGPQLVQSVSRHDPAVHNTRRFAAAGLELAGLEIRPGDGLVLLLAGAQPFGAGAHACPGERIALAIAAAALDAAGDFAFLGAHAGYRPLPNARIPVFAA
jgi:cytochrome P450